MFESTDQAVAFMESIAFYNRFCGEFVVMGFFYANQIASFF